MMEKRNIVNDRRTPKPELHRTDDDWDKKAADEFESTKGAKKVKKHKDK